MTATATILRSARRPGQRLAEPLLERGVLVSQRELHLGKASLRGFLVAATVLMGAAVILALAPGGNPLAMAIALAGVWGFGWHLTWQLRQLDIDDPETCLRLFRSNRDAGLLPALLFAVAALV